MTDYCTKIDWNANLLCLTSLLKLIKMLTNYDLPLYKIYIFIDFSAIKFYPIKINTVTQFNISK